MPRFTISAQLSLGQFIKSRDAHVKGEIACGFSLGLASPQFKRFQRFIRFRRANHLDERRRAADERGFAAGAIIVLRERAHERQVNVDVRINEAGKTNLPFASMTSAPLVA